MATVLTRGVPLGIDFTGGTLVVVEFPQEEVTEERVRVLRFRDCLAMRSSSVRRPCRPPVHDSPAARVIGQRRLRGHGPTDRARVDGIRPARFAFEKRELVSAVIGSDLQRRGVYAVAASLAAITFYIGIRFRASFAVGAITATLHDVLVTLACVSLAGYDLSLNVIAALLTIIGYSVNDTIVIFDRVRENAKRMPVEGLDAVVNLSVNQTLSRTVITAGTTFLSVVALYVFGGEALRGFAFTMLVGIVAGTYRQSLSPRRPRRCWPAHQRHASVRVRQSATMQTSCRCAEKWDLKSAPRGASGVIQKAGRGPHAVHEDDAENRRGQAGGEAEPPAHGLGPATCQLDGRGDAHGDEHHARDGADAEDHQVGDRPGRLAHRGDHEQRDRCGACEAMDYANHHWTGVGVEPPAAEAPIERRYRCSIGRNGGARQARGRADVCARSRHGCAHANARASMLRRAAANWTA